MTLDEKKEAIRRHLETKGYRGDRWGHMVRETMQGGKYRYKFQAHTIRYEVRNTLGEWMRIKTHNVNEAYDKLFGAKK